jgi:polyhydroxyalkanoate synthesis regulator phasin
MSKDSPEKMESLAKKIWLAGLGAYGHSLDGFQNGYDKLSEESQKLFDDLVAKGEALQSQATDAVKDKVKEGNNRLEARAEELKKKLSITSSLSNRLEEMSKKIDKLSQNLAKKGK